MDRRGEGRPRRVCDVRHGGLDEWGATCCESRSNPLPEKGRAKTIVGLLESDHPRGKGALASSAADIADWLDGECEELWPDWEAGTHNNMPTEALISELLACLAVEKNPDAIAADALPASRMPIPLPRVNPRGLFSSLVL